MQITYENCYTTHYTIFTPTYAAAMETGVEMWERPMFLWRDKQGYGGLERVMRFMVETPDDEKSG